MGNIISCAMISIGLLVMTLSLKVGEFWTELVYKDGRLFYSEHFVFYSITIALIGFSLLMCELLKLVFKRKQEITHQRDRIVRYEMMKGWCRKMSLS